MRKVFKTTIAYLLIGSLALGILTGCKETDVLKEIIYGSDTNIIDTDQAYVDNNQDNTEEDPDMYSVTDADDSNREETESVNEDNDSMETSDEHAANVETNPEKETTGNNGNEASTDSTRETSENQENSGGETSEETTEPETDDPGNTPSATYTAAKNDPDNSYQTISDNGNEVEVPANANIVVAAGEAAIMIEMLGENTTGHDILYATSGSVLDNSIATTVFPDLINGKDQNGNGVVRLWDGDGSSYEQIIQANFDQLITDADNIDVVFYVDGVASFSDEQLTQMKAAGISVVCLYKMNTYRHLEENAELIGRILGSHPSGSTANEGINSKNVASAYISWVENSVIANFKNSHFANAVHASIYLDPDSGGGTESASAINNSNGQYTVLVDYWDDTAVVSVNGTVLNTGAGAATANYYITPVSYFMQIAGVVNTAAVQSDFWPSFLKDNEAKKWYLNQYTLGPLGTVNIVGKYGTYKPGYAGAGNEEESGPYLSMVGADKTYTNITANLGTDKFNKVIASSKKIAENLKTSSTFSVGGIAQLEGSQSTIMGDYTIVVNPCGAGSWIRGSVEAPLESYWISETFGTSTPDDNKSLYDKTKEFYETFYRFGDEEGEDFDSIYELMLDGEQ